MQFSRWQHYSRWQLSLARSSPLLQSKKTGVFLELLGGSVTQKCKWVVWCTVADVQERSESKVPFCCCSAAFWQCSQGTLAVSVPVCLAPPPQDYREWTHFRQLVLNDKLKSEPFKVPYIKLCVTTLELTSINALVLYILSLLIPYFTFLLSALFKRYSQIPDSCSVHFLWSAMVWVKKKDLCLSSYSPSAVQLCLCILKTKTKLWVQHN